MGFVGFGSIMPIYMFFMFISYFCALYQQNPNFKPSKTLTNHIQTSYVQISTKTHNRKEIENYIEKKTKPIPFLEDW